MSKNPIIQICVRGCGPRDKRIIIDKTKCIKHLYQKIKEELQLSRELQFGLSFGGVPLNKDSRETIEFKGIAHYSTLDFCVLMCENPRDDETEKTKHQISVNNTDLCTDIEFVLEGDCCVCWDDKPGVSRVRMSCGCVIGIGDGDDCLKTYCLGVVKGGHFLFTCPGCKSTWQHRPVCKALSTTLTTEELKSFTEKVTYNFALDCQTFQSCPKCENYITHDPQTATGFRNKYWVRCPICTRKEQKNVEFCWVCLNPWRGDNSSCGNKTCTGKDPRIHKLQTCGTKSIGNVDDVPVYRACVKCGWLIEHTDQCKHMACKFCGCQFCFVCLKPQIENSEKWQCGSYNSVCEVAPRQTLLFHI